MPSGAARHTDVSCIRTISTGSRVLMLRPNFSTPWGSLSKPARSHRPLASPCRSSPRPICHPRVPIFLSSTHGLLQKNKLSPWSAWGSLLLPPRSSLQKMNGVNRMCNTILTKKGGESALRSAQWRAHLARVENRLPLCADTVRVGASLR